MQLNKEAKPIEQEQMQRLMPLEWHMLNADCCLLLYTSVCLQEK